MKNTNLQTKNIKINSKCQRSQSVCNSAIILKIHLTCLPMCLRLLIKSHCKLSISLKVFFVLIYIWTMSFNQWVVNFKSLQLCIYKFFYLLLPCNGTMTCFVCIQLFMCFVQIYFLVDYNHQKVFVYIISTLLIMKILINQFWFSSK